jgi:hypothetical protein
MCENRMGQQVAQLLDSYMVMTVQNLGVLVPYLGRNSVVVHKLDDAWPSFLVAKQTLD